MDAAQIAIIGGADGPTSIFITTSVNWSLVIGSIIGVAIVVGFIVWKKRRK